MSKGFINITTSQHGNIDYYARAGECLLYHHSEASIETLEQLRQAWAQIESREKLGDSSLGIRGRHDAQVRKNYILSMPNSLSPQACVERVKNVLDQTQIKECTYTIFVHRGQKEAIQNQHVHVLVNERNRSTQKKDRVMISKKWLMDTFRPSYEKEFEKEFSEGKSVEKRERIAVEIFEYAGPSFRAELKSESKSSREEKSQAKALERKKLFAFEVERQRQEMLNRKNRTQSLRAWQQMERDKEKEKEKEKKPTPPSEAQASFNLSDITPKVLAALYDREKNSEPFKLLEALVIERISTADDARRLFVGAYELEKDRLASEKIAPHLRQSQPLIKTSNSLNKQKR